MIKKSIEYGSLFLFLAFIGLIIIIFYNYLTTPNVKPLPFLVVIYVIMIYFLFNHGELVGRYLKRKNFHTEGGLSGVYLRHEDLPNGMSIYYFTTQKRYLQNIGYEDYQERNILERFFTRWTNTRVASVINHSYTFEEVPDYMSDTDEGCIKYRGTLRKGVKVSSPIEVLKIKLDNAYAIISEFATITEKAKAVSEQSAQAQSKDIVDAVIKVGTAIQNLPSQQPRIYPPQQGSM